MAFSKALQAILASLFCLSGDLAVHLLLRMPRGNQLRAEHGGVFHVTHRCHNRSFLLKFARDRDAYRSLLREHLRQFDVALLDHCITSNHVHLLLDACERETISGLMREVAGEFSRYSNRRKERRNS